MTQKLSIEDFGAHLLRTGDLDPIYLALHRIALPYEQRCRWMLAYWAFYHAGQASYISEFEGTKYWEMMVDCAAKRHQAGLPAWSRGMERQRQPGVECIAAVNELWAKYGKAELFVQYCYGAHCPSAQPFAAVSDRVKSHRQYGPWMAFKVCDMIERNLGWPITFDDAAVFMFKDPVKAAVMLWELHNCSLGNSKEEMIHWAVAYVQEKLGHFLAPPGLDRKINLQEIETILCKWKSHMHNKYPLNKDINEIRHGLAAWVPLCETAKKYFEAMPDGVMLIQ